MKKLLIVMMLITSTAIACDCTCACGGKKPEGALSILVKTGAVFVGAKFAGPVLVVPLVIVDITREQRAYNAAHGITHSRKNRRRKKSIRS